MLPGLFSLEAGDKPVVNLVWQGLRRLDWAALLCNHFATRILLGGLIP